VPALERLLIDADVAEGERRAALDPPHGVPPEFQLAADRGHGGFPQPVDRQPLEQQGELRARGRPRDDTLQDAMGRAVDARHARMEPGL